MTVFEYIKKCWRESANLEGRARRKEYWSFRLFVSTIELLIIVGGIYFLFTTYSRLSSLCLLLLIVFDIIIFKSIHAVAVRRLQDSNMNGNWTVLRKIPIVGYIWLTILMLRSGSEGENRYGENPRGNDSVDGLRRY